MESNHYPASIPTPGVYLDWDLVLGGDLEGHTERKVDNGLVSQPVTAPMRTGDESRQRITADTVLSRLVYMHLLGLGQVGELTRYVYH